MFRVHCRRMFRVPFRFVNKARSCHIGPPFQNCTSFAGIQHSRQSRPRTSLVLPGLLHCSGDTVDDTRGWSSRTAYFKQVRARRTLPLCVATVLLYACVTFSVPSPDGAWTSPMARVIWVMVFTAIVWRGRSPLPGWRSTGSRAGRLTRQQSSWILQPYAFSKPSDLDCSESFRH